jgi:hypothetical protein
MGKTASHVATTLNSIMDFRAQSMLQWRPCDRLPPGFLFLPIPFLKCPHVFDIVLPVFSVLPENFSHPSDESKSMNHKVTCLGAILISAVIASGCATYGGYQPAVDTYNDPNAYRLPQDQQECSALAKQAGSAVSETAKGVGAGALLGAATGAALGAIAGNPGTGAALGAAAGGIGGGAYQGVDADSQYKRAYINCLRGRGHNVIN